MHVSLKFIKKIVNSFMCYKYLARKESTRQQKNIYSRYSQNLIQHSKEKKY